MSFMQKRTLVFGTLIAVFFSIVLVVLLLSRNTPTCPNTFMSWNIANFGRSHSDSEVEVMAHVLATADIVAVQEVTAGKNSGAQAVARLSSALSRTGSEWDYIVS